MHRKQQSLSTGTAAHSLAFFFLLFFKALCVSLPSLWPHLSLFLFHLSVFCIFITFPPFFFAPEVSFSPPPTLVSTPPLSVLSLLSSPAAMWSRRGSGVTEAGPFGVASSLSRLRGAAVPARWVFAPVCVCVCERGAVLEGKVRCERMMHLIHCEEKRKK